MEYIIIIANIITIILLKIGLNIHIKDLKKVKEIGYDKDLNKIADKFPENKKICEDILKKLHNTNVKIEEDENTKTSLYIAISNKIVIANMKDTFARIQTIAHECLHSVQNRSILLFNFMFSNIYLIYFIASIFLIAFNVGNNLIYILTYIFLGLIYLIVRIYLEDEAMSKAYYVAKEYMQDKQKSKENKEEKDNQVNKEKQDNKNKIEEKDVNTILINLEKINKIGIPLTNFSLSIGVITKVIILSAIALIF